MKLVNFFIKGHEQSIEIKKNIVGSFIIKGFSIFLGLYFIPVMLNYLDKETFGIWLTLYSIIHWMSFFNIGLGNGLRNKLVEAISKNDYKLAKTYVSTTYASLSMIIAVVLIIFLFINKFLHWGKILNADFIPESELSAVVLLTFSFFCIRFVLKLIGIIVVADQKTALNTLFSLLYKTLTLIGILILTKYTSGSLFKLAIIFNVTPVIVYFVASIYFFSKNYKRFRPSVKFIDFSHFHDLATLGFKFFFLQIGAVILFTSSNLIITHVLGPGEVTIYNIAKRYFNIVFMLFSIMMRPLWSAYTKAYFRHDVEWIKRITRKLLSIALFLSFVVIIMILISKPVYAFWVGKDIHVPLILSCLMGIFTIIKLFAAPFVNFINGVGKIKLSFRLSPIPIILNIPLAIFFAKQLQLGSAGVILAASICNLISVTIGPIQYYKIVNNKAKGIWNQ